MKLGESGGLLMTEHYRRYLCDILADGSINEEWREEDVARTKLRLSRILQAQGKPTDANNLSAQAEEYLFRRRPTVKLGKGWTDHKFMELLDSDISLSHGRTTGIWSNGVEW